MIIKIKGSTLTIARKNPLGSPNEALGCYWSNDKAFQIMERWLDFVSNARATLVNKIYVLIFVTQQISFSPWRINKSEEPSLKNGPYVLPKRKSF